MDETAEGYAAAWLAAREWKPERLTFAREAAGLNQVQLANRVGITSSAISQFESGRMAPGADTVAKLALVLKCPPQFFRSGARPCLDMSSCVFSNHRGVPLNERRRVVRLATIVSWLTDELESRGADQGEDVVGLQGQFETADAGPEAVARLVRDRLELGDGPIEDVVAVLEDMGIVVVGWSGVSTGPFAGWRSDGVPVAFFDPDSLAPACLRFEAARQLGHLVMHGAGAVDTNATKGADAFALAFLMPATTFGREYPTPMNWTHLRILKRRWGVSLEEMTRRALQLSLISEATFRRRCTELNERGWRGNEPDEPSREFPRRIVDAVEAAVESGRPLSDLAMAMAVDPAMLRGLLADGRHQRSLVAGF
jgi:Zn-dependent peptidase ImmA (M78 family)/DNA-binding XRE family transcriptional regulator